MNVALTSTVFNREGGISRYVYELAHGLSMDAGVGEVHVLTGRNDDGCSKLRFHRSPTIFKPISARILSNTFFNTLIGHKLKFSGVVDVVHGNGAEYVRPDVLTAHSVHKAGVAASKKVRGGRYGLLKFFEPRSNVVLGVEKLNYSLLGDREVIAVSSVVKGDIVDCYGVCEDKIHVVYNGVDSDFFRPGDMLGREVLRCQLGFSPDDVVAVFCGWEFRRKGLMQIIDSLRYLKNVKVLVLGSGDKTPFVERAIRLGVVGRVVFVGHVCPLRFYQASDLLLFPTLYEPFGLVITEAMACGLPVVTSRCAGAGELITDGVEGLLLDDPCCVGEIVEAVDYIIDNDLFRLMGDSGRSSILPYSWGNNVKQTLNIYLKGDL